jgi:SAM-dependent methyltransferase
MVYCPACDTPGQHFLRFYVNGCRIWQCQGCGLGRTETERFDPTTYYTADYFSGRHSDGYSDYLGTQPVLRAEFARSVDFVRRFHDGGRLLELGCAYGFFLEEARPYFDVAGIELAEDAAEHCRRKGLQVYSGLAEEPTLQRIGPTNAIVLFDVIEHLTDPRETLARCERHLEPGGIIVITTGDFASFTARLCGAHWRLMTPPQHLWFFTPKSLGALSSGLGLTMEHLDHPWKIVPLSLILFQLSRIAGRPRRPVGGISRMGVPVNLFDAMRIVLRKSLP